MTPIWGMRAGDTVYVLVTDHPNYPAVTYDDDHFLSFAFRDLGIAERTRDAWNSYYTITHTPQPYPWRIEQRTIQTRPTESANTEAGQLSLYEAGGNA